MVGEPGVEQVLLQPSKFAPMRQPELALGCSAPFEEIAEALRASLPPSPPQPSPLLKLQCELSRLSRDIVLDTAI